MPIDFSTSLELDLVYARWSGQVDLALFRTAFSRYLSDIHYRPGRPELIDFTEVTGFEADFRKIWSALRMVNNQVPGERVTTRSVLIAPQDVIYGFARMYQTLAENAKGIRVEVYRSEAAALGALGLPYKSSAEMLRDQAFLPFVPKHKQS